MEKNNIPSKLVPPPVAFKDKSDYASNINQKKSLSPEPTSVPHQEKPSSQKPSSLRNKKPKQEARYFPFQVYEPYDKPVELRELLDEIAKCLRKFVIIDAVQADAAALWIFHTYVVMLFDTSPIAIINAPERACAKTLFQTVLSYLSSRPLSASNATASALFRSVELWMPTIFFDEADTFFKDNNDLLGMVNAGYKSNGFVLRSEAVNDSFVPRQFSVFSAKSIAGIALEKHLHDSTMSRGIIFNMRRKLPNETVVRLRYAEEGLFVTLCAKLERAADDYEVAIQEVRPFLPEELNDRAQDNWEPLLAIATVAGGDWLERATKAALTLSNQSTEKVSTGNELLADIQMVFEKRAHGDQYSDKISSAELITELQKIEESPWATYNHGYPLSPRQLASQLATYHIKSKTVRLGPFETPKGYERDQFIDAFSRYLNPTDEPVNESSVDTVVTDVTDVTADIVPAPSIDEDIY